jgi:hypothetical protein
MAALVFVVPAAALVATPALAAKHPKKHVAATHKSSVHKASAHKTHTKKPAVSPSH